VRDRRLQTERELFLYEEGRREFEDRAERVYEEYNRVVAQRQSSECWRRIAAMEEEIRRVKGGSPRKVKQVSVRLESPAKGSMRTLTSP
jgi:hypothetical protein